jgi:hypothetical protein
MNQNDVDKVFDNLMQKNYHLFFKKDIELIQETVLENCNVFLNDTQVVLFWEDYSDSLAAGWLGVDSKDEIIMAFDSFMERYKHANF